MTKRDEQHLTDSEISAFIAENGFGWKHVGNELVCEVLLEDFVSALRFVNEVGGAAESLNHHPDIDIRWNKVVLYVRSHDVDGLTIRDIELVKSIDRIRRVQDKPGINEQASPTKGTSERDRIL